MGDVVGQLGALALGELGVAADRGQRRAQLVAGVGDELAHPGLAGVSRRQRARDAVEHPVQRGTELADLGVGACRVDAHDRRRQIHLTPVQLEVGHLAGRGGDPRQRGQLAPDDQDARGRRADQRDRGDHAEHAEHPQQRVVDDGGRQTRHDGLPAVPGVQADQPVAAKAVELDGLRPPVGRYGGELGGGDGAHPGPATVCGDDACVHRAVPRDDRADGPRRLTRCVQEPGAGAELRIEPLPVGESRRQRGQTGRWPGKLGRPSLHPWCGKTQGPGERWRRHVEDRGRSPARLEQLSVELMGQEALQRELGRNADAGAHDREQQHLDDQQANPQRPGARRPEPGPRHRGRRFAVPLRAISRRPAPSNLSPRLSEPA